MVRTSALYGHARIKSRQWLIRQAHVALMGYGNSSVHQRKDGVGQFLSSGIVRRRTERYCQQWASRGRVYPGFVGNLARDQCAQLRNVGLARATLIVVRNLFELLGRCGRYFPGMLIRRGTTAGHQNDREPGINEEPDPLGKSIEKYPGRLKRPSGHVKPEPYPLSRPLPREFRIVASERC